eukprot:TRINITY_DN3680_c0_g2_i1.p1 TRINITY_DN3680_c0_g2~~TRINITY_DN3680_c0_g2_i1.p1  ORF type:complete len:1476 (-),score=466.28 TRINITY_DN3680_c0_g2_i1:545-4972(-)
MRWNSDGGSEGQNLLVKLAVAEVRAELQAEREAATQRAAVVLSEWQAQLAEVTANAATAAEAAALGAVETLAANIEQSVALSVHHDKLLAAAVDAARNAANTVADKDTEWTAAHKELMERSALVQDTSAKVAELQQVAAALQTGAAATNTALQTAEATAVAERAALQQQLACDLERVASTAERATAQMNTANENRLAAWAAELKGQAAVAARAAAAERAVLSEGVKAVESELAGARAALGVRKGKGGGLGTGIGDLKLRLEHCERVAGAQASMLQLMQMRQRRHAVCAVMRITYRQQRRQAWWRFRQAIGAVTQQEQRVEAQRRASGLLLQAVRKAATRRKWQQWCGAVALVRRQDAAYEGAAVLLRLQLRRAFNQMVQQQQEAHQHATLDRMNTLERELLTQHQVLRVLIEQHQQQQQQHQEHLQLVQRQQQEQHQQMQHSHQQQQQQFMQLQLQFLEQQQLVQQLCMQQGQRQHQCQPQQLPLSPKHGSDVPEVPVADHLQLPASDARPSDAITPAAATLRSPTAADTSAAAAALSSAAAAAAVSGAVVAAQASRADHEQQRLSRLRSEHEAQRQSRMSSLSCASPASSTNSSGTSSSGHSLDLCYGDSIDEGKGSRADTSSSTSTSASDACTMIATFRKCAIAASSMIDTTSTTTSSGPASERMPEHRALLPSVSPPRPAAVTEAVETKVSLADDSDGVQLGQPSIGNGSHGCSDVVAGASSRVDAGGVAHSCLEPCSDAAISTMDLASKTTSGAALAESSTAVHLDVSTDSTTAAGVAHDPLTGHAERTTYPTVRGFGKGGASGGAAAKALTTAQSSEFSASAVGTDSETEAPGTSGGTHLVKVQPAGGDWSAGQNSQGAKASAATPLPPASPAYSLLIETPRVEGGGAAGSGGDAGKPVAEAPSHDACQHAFYQDALYALLDSDDSAGESAGNGWRGFGSTSDGASAAASGDAEAAPTGVRECNDSAPQTSLLNRNDSSKPTRSFSPASIPAPATTAALTEHQELVALPCNIAGDSSTASDRGASQYKGVDHLSGAAAAAAASTSPLTSSNTQHQQHWLFASVGVDVCCSGSNSTDALPSSRQDVRDDTFFSSLRRRGDSIEGSNSGGFFDLFDRPSNQAAHVDAQRGDSAAHESGGHVFTADVTRTGEAADLASTFHSLTGSSNGAGDRGIADGGNVSDDQHWPSDACTSAAAAAAMAESVLNDEAGEAWGDILDSLDAEPSMNPHAREWTPPPPSGLRRPTPPLPPPSAQARALGNRQQRTLEAAAPAGAGPLWRSVDQLEAVRQACEALSICYHFHLHGECVRGPQCQLCHVRGDDAQLLHFYKMRQSNKTFPIPEQPPLQQPPPHVYMALWQQQIALHQVTPPLMAAAGSPQLAPLLMPPQQLMQRVPPLRKQPNKQAKQMKLPTKIVPKKPQKPITAQQLRAALALQASGAARAAAAASAAATAGAEGQDEAAVKTNIRRRTRRR